MTIIVQDTNILYFLNEICKIEIHGLLHVLLGQKRDQLVISGIGPFSLFKRLLLLMLLTLFKIFSAYFNVTQFVKINRVTFSRTIHFFLLYFLSLHRCVWCTFQSVPFLPQNMWCVLQDIHRLRACLIQDRSAF